MCSQYAASVQSVSVQPVCSKLVHPSLQVVVEPSASVSSPVLLWHFLGPTSAAGCSEGRQLLYYPPAELVCSQSVCGQLVSNQSLHNQSFECSRHEFCESLGVLQVMVDPEFLPVLDSLTRGGRKPADQILARVEWKRAHTLGGSLLPPNPINGESAVLDIGLAGKTWFWCAMSQMSDSAIRGKR